MIHESAPWKERLGKDAEIIERWAAKPKITSRRSFVIEQKVFLAAYAIRKLLEGRKLSSSFEGHTFRCQMFSVSAGQMVTFWNIHRFDELYDLSKPAKRATNVPDLLDLIVHSMVFGELLRDDDTVEGFLVTSDRKRSNLWFVDLSDFTAMMRQVSKDYPSVAVRMFDRDTKEWIFWQGDGDPPAHTQKKMEKARSAWRK